MRCAKCIHHNICYYEEEVIAPDKNNECENFAEERPQGEWIEVPVKRDILHPNGIKYVCSACKRDNCYGKPPFCMWCGATMKSEEEEQHESQ